MRKTKAQLVNELVELRQQFNSFLYFLPDALIEVDILTPRLTRMNRAAYNLFGYTEQDLAEIQIPQLFAENEYERAVEVVTGYVAESQESGVEYVHSAKQELYEFLMRKKDGSVFHAETQTSFILDQDGIPIKMQTIIRDITEHKRSGEALRRYTGQLEALREVGLELAAQMDLDVLLRSIVSRAIGLMRGTDGGLYIHQPEQDVLEWAVAIGPNVTPTGTVLHRGDGLAGRVWETGEPIIVDNYRHWNGRAAAYLDHPFTAIVGVPVRWGDEFLGVLNVHADSPRTFSAADAELLSLLAAQAAIAIRNARLYEQAQQEIAERRRLEHKSEERRLYLESVLVSAPDAIVTLDAQHNILEWNSGAERLFGYTLEEAVGRNIDTLVVGPGNDVFEEATGFTSQVLAGRSIPPTETVRYRKDGSPVDVILAGSPILLGDQMVGVVTIYTDITARAQAEVERGRLLAAEREQRELAEALGAAAAALSSTLDFDQVLDLILEQTRRVVPSDAANVMLIEKDQARVVRWQGHERFGAEQFVSTAVFPVSDVPNLAQMVEHKAPVVTPDTAADPGWVRVPVQEWIRSYAGVPICVRDQVVGFLNVDSATPGFFTPVHARRLQAFASYAAYAIENARLYEQAQQEIAERRRAEQALRESEERYRAIFEQAADSIVLIDSETGALVEFNDWAHESLGYTREEFQRLKIPDFEIIESAEQVTEHFQKIVREGADSFETKHRTKDGKIRDVLVSSKSISVGGTDFIQTIFHDITDSKRAEETLRRRAEELAALQATVLDITTPHDLPTLLQDIIERATYLLDAQGGGLYLCDPDQEQARCVASYNTPRDYTGTVLKYGEGAAGTVAQTGEPLIIDDYRTWTKRSPTYEDDQPFTAVLSVPMIWQGQVTGVIHVTQDVEDRRFTQADLDLLTLFANHAAIAVENTRLYEEARQELTERVRAEEALTARVEQLAALNYASYAVTASLQVNQVLAEIVSLTNKVMASDYATVLLIDETGHIAQSTDDLPGVPSIEIRARAGGLTEWIARSGQAVIIDEINEDGVIVSDLGAGAPRFVNPHVVEAGIKSVAGLPLIARGNLLGVLYLHSLRPDAFRNQLPLLTTFANQAATAIENARLYEAAQQELAERVRAEEALRSSEEYTRNLIESSLDTIISVDMERHIVEFNKSAQETFGYSAEEILGQHIDMLYADPHDGLQVHQTTIEAGRCVREAPGLRKDGQVFPSLISASALHDARGELVGVMGVSRDITESKRAEAQLQHRLEEMALLNQITTLTASAGDVAGALHEVCAEMARFLQVPQACLALFNPQRTAAEVIADCHPPGGPGTIGVIIPVDGNPSMAYILEHKAPLAVTQAQTDPLLEPVHDIMRRQGIQSMLLVPVLVEGEVIGMLGFDAFQQREFNKADVDLVQHVAGQVGQMLMRKRAEEARRESDERYRSLFDGVPVGLYRSTPLGEILDANPALVQIMGYPDRETLLTASAADVYLKADDRRRWQALVEREEIVRDFETQIRRRDGAVIWVRDTGRVVRDADGSALYYEGSLEDITARNLATRALHRYSDRLQTLHQIDQAILAAQSPDMIIQPVLRYLGQLIPCWAVGVVMFDFEADEMTVFISDTIAFESEVQAGIRLPLAMFKDIEEGIAELGRGEVYVVQDLLSIFPPSQLLQILNAREERPAIAVPLRFREELIGLIGFGVTSPDALTPEHIVIAREVAASLAVAFQQARLLEETQARWREAETLRQAGATLTETLSLAETLDRILEQLDQVVPYDSASVQLLGEGQMEIVGGRGFAEPEMVIGSKFPVPGDNPNTTVVVERRPIILADAQAAHPPFREPPHDHIHSWLGVPLILRGQAIGILAVDSVELAHFTDRHVRLVAPFATQAAIAIENARLYEEARQHAEELSLLYQAARDTSASLEPAEVMRRLAGSVRQAAAATSVDVLVLDETGARVTVMAQCASPQASPAESEPDVGTTYDLTHHPAILEMVRTRQPVITYADDPTLDPTTREMMAQFGGRSALRLPLLVSGEVRGYVLVWNSQQQYEWNDDTVRLCQALIGSAVVALENARLYEEAQQRLQELVILVESGAMVASILDISELLPRIAELMANLLGVDACAISDWRKEEGVVRTLAEYRGTAPDSRDGTTYRLADYPATAQLLHEGQPFQMRVDDPIADGKERADLEEWKMQSLLALPIADEGGVIGLLELYDIEQSRTFSPEEIARGQAWAKQMAPLVEMITTVEEEGEQKLGSAMRELAVQAMRDLALHWCVISRWDPAGDQVVTVAEYGDAVWSGGGGAGYSLADYPATARVLHQRQPLVVRVDDLATDEGERALLKEEGWGTMLALPMVVKQETIGLVELFDSRCRSFTSSEIELCQTVVRQAAIAIENSRLYEQARKEIAERKRVDETLRRRNRELALLNRASQSLASTLDLDEVLAIVLGEVRRLLDVTACSVWLIDSDTDELVCLQAVTPQDEMVRGWRLAPGQGICGWVARHGESLIVPDVWADERYFRGVDEQAELGLRAILTVPLLVKGGVIGVLQVLDTEVGRFDKTDLELMEPLVASAAIAIENARLYEEARQRVAELEALQHTSLQLTSTLDLSAVFDTIAESALTLMAATDCHIYLYDQTSDTFTFGTALWEDGRREAAVEAPRSDGFTATVARQGHAMVINDTAQHPLYATPEAQKWGIQAIAGFPLKRAGRVLGVFNIAFLTPHTFGEDDLRVLGLLADQAASAIENARLYEETAKRLAQTEVLREMMLAAASTLNFDQVLNRTIEILERALGVEYLGFMLPDEDGEFMKSHPSILGFTPPEGGFRFPTDQCITGRAYRTGQPVIVSDVREVTDYAVSDEEAGSELAVPVRVGDEVVAVLNLESSKLDAFGDEELTFYTAVAGQLGVAMENARLYEQARRDAATKAMLLREVNHRVKNNLTAIIGLLQAERRHADTSAWGGEGQNVYRVIMHDLVNRVQGLATVHSMLSASEWNPLPLNELTIQIIYSSLQMLPRDRRVSVNVSPSPIRVTSDQAHDLALVINELVTNTVKHGMQERDEACITVRIELDEETVTLEFRDDGPGYPEEMLRSERSSVGFDLIRNIVRQNLRGDLALYNDLGAVAVIRFALLVTCD